MNAPTRLGAFGAVLALALGGGVAAGTAFGPEPDEARPAGHSIHDEESDDMNATTALPGLAVSDQGYTLKPERPDLPVGGGPFRFAIDGPGGTHVRAFTVEHDKELHLIVASRDLSRFAHLHPERDALGVWSVDLPPLPAGPYRVFADFRAEGGPALTLGVDGVVAGDYQPPARPVARAEATVDGFAVSLVGEPAAGSSSLVVQVRHGEAPVVLEPYLGADGHLVALRDGDLAYLHVHPEHGGGVGDVPFGVKFPSPGRYRLFFDFQVDGVVRTADFTVDIAPRSGDDPAPPTTALAADGHGH